MNITIENTEILLKNTTTLLLNSTFVNINLTLVGNKTNRLSVNNCTFISSTVTLDFMASCNIEFCWFIAGNVHERQAPKYMLTVINTNNLFIKESVFRGQEIISKLTNNIMQFNETANITTGDGSVITIDEYLVRGKISQIGLYLNRVTLADIHKSNFTNLVSETSNGSAIYCKASQINVNESLFHQNKAKNGIIWIGHFANLTTWKTTFSKNQAEKYGGVLVVEGQSVIKNTGSFFIHNSGMEGCAIHAINMAYIENIRCLFLNNKCTGTDSHSGGALFLEQGVRCSNIGSLFKSNSAKNGGAVLIRDAMIYNFDSTFHKNFASGYGGAINSENNGQCLNKKTIFDGNSAWHGGGAVDLYNGGNCTNIETTFIQNTCMYFMFYAIFENQVHSVTLQFFFRKSGRM